MKTLSVNKLLELRAKFARLRRSFRDTVQRRTAAIATLPSSEAIRLHLEGLAKEMQEELEEQREALHGAQVRDAWTLVGVGVPVSIAGAAGLAGAPALAATAGAFGPVGLGAIDWFLERSKRKRSDGSYLLSLGHDLDRTKTFRDLSDRMRRLTGGAA